MGAVWVNSEQYMSQEEYFSLVKALANDLNGNKIELPSFPDVVVRIRTALNDSDATADSIARILSVDVVLASRILILANSTYHNPAGIKIEGLDAAVGRIGFEKVRTAAIAFAVEQLYVAKGQEAIKHELRENWSAGLQLAAMSESIARSCTKLDADSAFIAGLLNRIGVLYIYSKVNEYTQLLKDQDSRDKLIDEWAAPIGESIVANWNFSDEIKATLNPADLEIANGHLPASLSDVVTAAKVTVNGDEDQLAELPEAKRLQLSKDNLPAVHDLFQKKMESLATAIR